jgi:hypothetical protein
MLASKFLISPSTLFSDAKFEAALFIREQLLSFVILGNIYERISGSFCKIYVIVVCFTLSYSAE